MKGNLLHFHLKTSSQQYPDMFNQVSGYRCLAKLTHEINHHRHPFRFRKQMMWSPWEIWIQGISPDTCAWCYAFLLFLLLLFPPSLLFLLLIFSVFMFLAYNWQVNHLCCMLLKRYMGSFVFIAQTVFVLALTEVWMVDGLRTFETWILLSAHTESFCVSRVFFALDIAQGMAHLHRHKMYHRRQKPANCDWSLLGLWISGKWKSTILAYLFS